MATRAMSAVIIGGHGNVSMRLARLLAQRPSTNVLSVIRDAAHHPEVAATGALTTVRSLEDDQPQDFAQVFGDARADVVYFSAGAGGKGGPERTKKVDEEGAIKIFDAIDMMEKGKRPRLILVSGIDIRDPNVIPDHYNESDIEQSKKTRAAIGAYMQAKYNADKNLASRTGFKWTILRPGGLSNEPGTGKAAVGKAHITRTISRDDVAKVLFLLLERDDAAGLGIDFAGGDDPIEESLDTFIKNGVSDFKG